MTKKISVLSATERQRVFGTFTYCELPGGRIEISPRWVAQNLTPCRLAKADGKGKEVVTQCHRLVKEPLERAFVEIAARGLWRLIYTFDGLWVARHMTWNARRPLSSHSWGIAFDLNAATNPYGGGISAENRVLNEVLSRYGFAWGGDWSGAKDAMHWELAQVEAWQRAGEPKPPRLILAVERNGEWSYHALARAAWDGGHFSVDAGEIARVFGSRQAGSALGGAAMPLRSALQALGARIIKSGDHRSDAYDPRYYVFVRTANQSAAAEATAP